MVQRCTFLKGTTLGTASVAFFFKENVGSREPGGTNGHHVLYTIRGPTVDVLVDSTHYAQTPKLSARKGFGEPL